MAKKKESPQPDKEQFEMFRDLFNKMYAEINEMKKKKPDGIVNAFKVERINRVFKPLYNLMKAYTLNLSMSPGKKNRVGVL